MCINYFFNSENIIYKWHAMQVACIWIFTALLYYITDLFWNFNEIIGIKNNYEQIIIIKYNLNILNL